MQNFFNISFFENRRSVLGALVVTLFTFWAGMFSSPVFSDDNTTNPMIKMTTSMGEITIETYPNEAPETVRNFLEYVNDGFFDGLIFHRVIPGFMVQGGGFDADMQQKDNGTPIQNEADNGLKNTVGTLSMARTGDPHSATSQFFINLVDNGFLDHSGKNPQGWGYAVFAKVIEGMDVVEKMSAVTTGQSGPHGDVPIESIVIEKAMVVE